ncbi:TIM-barrel domain-containing protein [Cellulomonas sp. P22]|uniref:glycoside hydrolase family 31 protein n=1 Tax=Cellulomonas sp. P22 TaxID=3373189 RepID=UPI0037AA9C42
MSAVLPDAPASVADPQAVVQGPGYRFTVLTSRLVRMERSDADVFVDAPTQVVRSRRFDVPEITVADSDDALDIWTEHLHVRYDKGPFTAAGLSVSMRTRAQSSHRTRWSYGDQAVGTDGRPANLGGTARTLDDVDGALPLEPGLLSVHGFAVLDDSRSLLLTDDGWVAPRPPGAGEDLYFFGYGRDYQDALRDFFALAGPSPLLPRWALGNWWSRYHRYTADEYQALMDRFAAAGIPFSVAVLDMDWHLVDIDPSLGSGWTGYTWDPGLFPDPAAFLAALHARHLRVTLNVHPADGVRRHEAAYADMARDLGIDPSSGLEIAFDISSREFVEAYLRRLHHPHEEIGVDFWWLDWQSGTNARVPGLDPLWMLNHVHHSDSARDGKRPLTFSRYAGLGSHRYPVGFSGDTVVTWASLDFQPYFTATAANVGYFWWSHDIGGHLGGVKDDELATRWFQLGAFSPVNRLHSTASAFNSKEPWRFGIQAEQVMTRFLRLRHQLVPYLYSAMWAAHTDGVAPVRPMYHDHPWEPDAYEVPNQQLFGPDLLVAPITSPADRATHLGQVAAWLPEGTWYDLFTGRRYDGGRRLVLHRTLEQLPVLARAGTVLPLAADPMADTGDNPTALVLRVLPGAGGRTLLVEDDGQGDPGPADRQLTPVALVWDEHGPDADGGVRADAVLTVEPPTGPGVSTARTLTLDLVGVDAVRRVSVGGRTLTVDEVGLVSDATHGARPGTGQVLRVELGTLDLTDGVEVHLEGLRRRGPDLHGDVFALLDEAEIAYDTKSRVMALVERMSGTALVSTLHGLDLPGNLYGAIVEVVAAAAE